MTFTVFLLIDPKEPDIIKYIGLTGQPLKWRLKSIRKMARYPNQLGYSTKLATWIRSMNTDPVVHSSFRCSIIEIAREKYLELFNTHYSVHLLNERPLLGKPPV